MLRFHSTVSIVFHWISILWLCAFIPEGAHTLCGGVLLLLLCEAVQDQRALLCCKSHSMHTCSTFAKVHCIELFSFRKLCNLQIEQIQITSETPQSYWTLQISPSSAVSYSYRLYKWITYNNVTNINSAVREATCTRECVSKWMEEHDSYHLISRDSSMAGEYR